MVEGTHPQLGLAPNFETREIIIDDQNAGEPTTVTGHR